MPHIDFWFDFISPYAYFAHLRIEAMASEFGATLRLRPVLFGALLDHHGHLGPAEIPSKREHLFKDIARYAALNDIPLTGPAKHPFLPVTALRVALPEVSGDSQPDVVRILFRATWSERADMGDPNDIARVLNEAGFDGNAMVSRTRNAEVKEALKREVALALERGIFGVPIVDCDGELFWGNDRLDMVRLRLQGKDPLPADAVNQLLQMPRGVVRPKAATQGTKPPPKEPHV